MINKLFKDLKKSITNKVNFIIISSIIIISIIFGIISFLVESRRLYRNAEKTSEQIAKRLENSLIQPAWEYNFDQINLIITLEMENPYIKGIIFQNLYEIVEAGKIKDKNEKINDYSPMIKIEEELNKCFKIIEIPVKEDNFTMGKVFLYVSDKILKKELLNIIIKNIFQIVFISILLAIIVIISFKKIVLNKILLLDNAVQKFSSKNLNIRTPLFSEDELGRLSNNFNKMADTISEYTEDMNNKVQQRTLQLEAANEQKTNFFINLAHETKTPLTLISNYLDNYLKKHNYSYELDIIKNNIEKLKRDMVNFLDVEKLERGQLFYNHDQIVNLTKVVNNTLLLFKEIAANKKIDVMEVISDKDIFIKIDPYAIDRVINNILENAIRYTDERGVICVLLREDYKNKVNFTVSDTGIGISEEKQKHIFESYYQISHRKRNIEGIGIGLSIVKKIVDQVDGEIQIDSKLNVGTTFSVIFNNYNLTNKEKVEKNIEYSNPIKIASIEKLHEEENEEGKYNILIVEDNIDLLAYLHNSMKFIYNVYYARNGVEALKKLQDIPKPNIILSDILMDLMDGYDLCYELLNNERFKDIPLIFLTAKTSLDEKILGLSKGAIDYIYKPFHINELLAKINSILKNQEITRESNVREIENKIAKALRVESSNDLDDNFNNQCIKYGISFNEKETIRLLIDGFEYKEISAKLNSPTNTIKKRIHNIYKKCKIHNKVELIKLMNY